MKKHLTEEQFQKAILSLDIGDQTKIIAHGVLVEKKPQTHFVKALGLSKGAVSQAVTRVWEAHQKGNLPVGFAKITAVLPEHQAYQVKVWSEKAKKQLETKEK